MTWIKTGLWLLIYEAFIINIALLDLSRMGFYIFWALMGPILLIWGSVIIKPSAPPRWLIVVSAVTGLLATILSFIVPSILL